MNVRNCLSIRNRDLVGMWDFLPLTDGSTAGTVVMSHCLADGIAGLFLVFDAITGTIRDLGYPPPRSRTRLRAAVSDFRETMQGLPEVCPGFPSRWQNWCLAAGAILPDRPHRRPLRPLRTVPTACVIVPAVSIYVDLDDWDARAKALDGDSYSLFAGFAAKLGEHLGRRNSDDGTVTLLIPYQRPHPGRYACESQCRMRRSASTRRS